MSGDERAAEADGVSVGVDGIRVFCFIPARHSYTDGLSRLSSNVMRREIGLLVDAMLTNAAKHAEWLQVNTFSYEEAIPAAG